MGFGNAMRGALEQARRLQGQMKPAPAQAPAARWGAFGGGPENLAPPPQPEYQAPPEPTPVMQDTLGSVREMGNMRGMLEGAQVFKPPGLSSSYQQEPSPRQQEPVNDQMNQGPAYMPMEVRAGAPMKRLVMDESEPYANPYRMSERVPDKSMAWGTGGAQPSRRMESPSAWGQTVQRSQGMQMGQSYRPKPQPQKARWAPPQRGGQQGVQQGGFSMGSRGKAGF